MTNRTKIWESEGLLWKNLSIYETETGFVGELSNSLSFMKDKEIVFPREMDFSDVKKAVIKQDADFNDEMTMYAEEG
jgi:hypothetical protein